MQGTLTRRASDENIFFASFRFVFYDNERAVNQPDPVRLTRLGSGSVHHRRDAFRILSAKYERESEARNVIFLIFTTRDFRKEEKNYLFL